MNNEKKTISTQEDFLSLITKGGFIAVNLDSYIFNCDIDLHNVNTLILTNCEFNKRFKISGPVSVDASFKNVKFNDVTDFTNVFFLKKVRFHGSIFHGEVRFHNTRFEDLADFYSTTFHKPTIFFKTDFLARTVFSASTFNENVLFTYTLIEKNLILRGTAFKKGLDLSLSILSGNINLFGLKISNYYSVPDITNETEYDDSVCNKGIIPHKNKRETFRILKKELLNQGNAIDSLNMAANEKIALSQQLKSDRKLKQNKWYRRLQDQFILYLGKISNGHGESWSRGVAFTIVVGFIFFYLSLISTEKYFMSFSLSKNWNCFSDASSYYIQFMIPTHTSEYMKNLNPNFLTYFTDFIGRIFVSFGIYQTVVAFRKYHTK